LTINPKSTAVIELDYNFIDRNWIMTAYINKKNKKKFNNKEQTFLGIYGKDFTDEPSVSNSIKDGTFSTSNALDTDILSDKNLKTDKKLDSYSLSQGIDTGGVNYIPTYKSAGVPTRPKDNKITIGKKIVQLPKEDNPLSANSIKVYIENLIGPRLYKNSDSAIRV
jgi:hypothetical protein